MTSQPHAVPQRAYFLDWLRIAAFGVLVIYHVGMYYVSWDWHVKSPFAGPGLEPWMMISSPWRMALLFLVSGAATSYLLQRGAGRPFLAGRSRRLLLPLLCGVLFIVPPQSYLEVLHKHGYGGDYLDFLRLYFSAYGGFCRAGACLILPTWNHLWFVAYLWVYTLLLLALLQWRPALLDSLAARCESLLAGPRLLWLPIAVLALSRLTLYPRFGSTHALVDDVYNHAVYLPMFISGAVFARCPGIWLRFERARWVALLLALLGYAVLAAFAVGITPKPLAPEAVLALQTLHRCAFASMQWSALAAALGFARRHLDHDHRWRKTLTEAVFPVYLLHQTLIIVLAQLLRPLYWAPALEAPVLIVGTFVASATGYLLVRRIHVLRPWFGIAGGPVRSLDPALRTTIAALGCLVLLGPLLGCAAAPPLQRSGNGEPAVVFQAGLGDGPEVWRAVVPRIEALTTAVALQRPGYGASALPVGPRDPCSIAADQRAALRSAGIAPPYVLVGHSLGGLYQYVYARLYPDDVAALVLVDATHPDHWLRLQADAPAMAATINAMSLLFSPVMKREFADQRGCLDHVAQQPRLRVPTRLLVRTEFALPERGAFERAVRQLQDDWLALTSAERIERVPGSGHYIQRERPDAVVRAVEDSVRNVRRSATLIAPPLAAARSRAAG